MGVHSRRGQVLIEGLLIMAFFASFLAAFIVMAEIYNKKFKETKIKSRVHQGSFL